MYRKYLNVRWQVLILIYKLDNLLCYRCRRHPANENKRLKGSTSFHGLRGQIYIFLLFKRLVVLRLKPTLQYASNLVLLY